MKKQGKRKGKRKLNEYKAYLKNQLPDKKEKNSIEKEKEENDDKYPNKNKKNNINNYNTINNKNLVKKGQNDSINLASKESCELIENLINKNNLNYDNIQNEDDDDEPQKTFKKSKINDDNDKNDSLKNENIGNITNKIEDNFLSVLYDLFDGYDEIIIKADKNKKYIINACIKIKKNKEIRFTIIYDKEREYFDYFNNNNNFKFEDEDEPFNEDLDIPKEDFCLLIRNFKKFKIN